MTRWGLGSAIRLTIASGLVAFIAMLGVADVLIQLRDEDQALRDQNLRLMHSLDDDQATMAELNSQIADLKSRWLGDPELWKPSSVPTNTTIEYFDVTGTTQEDLIKALNNDGLCTKFRCAPDPAVPAGSVAWALEGDGSLDPPGPYCYSPRDDAFHWSGHSIWMPRWTPKPGTVKTSLVEAWNALQGVLWTHEVGHVTVAEDWLAGENATAAQLSTCQAAVNFWADPHLFDSLQAAQAAYHAKLRADCRPEVGCLPPYWMGW